MQSSPRTRAQTARQVKQAAFADDNVNDVLLVIFLRDGQQFLDKISYNPTLGMDLESLVVRLSYLDSIPTRLCRGLMLAATGVTSLVLNTPPHTPMTVFSGVVLPRLQFFETNLPHRLLTAFLANHTTITLLNAPNCGRSAHCPLSDLDFAHLRQLACPRDCAASIIHAGVTSLETTVSSHTRGPIPTVTSIVRLVPMAFVVALTLHISPTDLDILGPLATAAPSLIILRLIEDTKTTQTRRNGTNRREWNNYAQWARQLRDLTFLHRLVIDTSADLIVQKRSEAAEKLLIQRWLTGRRNAPEHDSHATLRSIGLRYGHSKPTRRVSSEWRGIASAATSWRRI